MLSESVEAVMIRRKVAPSVSIIFLVATAVAASPQTQQSPSQSADEVRGEAARFYADAHPYLDAPFSELKKVVHELSGMTPASSQEQLPDLLDEVGLQAYELLQRVPDLVSEEVVNETRRTIPKGEPLGCVGKGCSPGRTASAAEDQTFDYLILTHPGAFGRVALSESRTTRKGKSVDPTLQSPKFQGFLPAWVLFYPVNQMESRFRYLGKQQIDGHRTLVIGFAQLPGSMASLDRPILLQGIAWVDQSDFRIVRLRTDLLAPLPEKKLQKETANIVFGPVDITQPRLQLWLPKRVDFEMEANGQFFHEDHKYSDYRLYKAATDSDAERTGSSPNRLSSSSSSGPKDQAEARTEAKLYAGALPYMDEPLSELRKTVHELAGLTPASGQGQLPDLLARTGAKADELLRKLPNLISDEGVSQSHYSQEVANGCVGVGCISAGDATTRDETYHYMILTRPAQGGRLAVSEYRTARNGKPIGQTAPGAPGFQGFISAWIVFSSANQAESRFRYLGQQRVNGHTTYVLGFAQTPGSVESPGEIVVNNESIPMLLQGIAWIDQSDFRIVRLRTDLLAPLPLILVEKQTANILFGPVHIADLAAELWLPKAVNLQMEVRGQVVREEHSYSKYRLFQAKSRIVLPSGDEPASR
jgi:hypothetical protein